ncbi:hypothetical protein NZD89_27415 [Alicyclobacillus fastidiosus]|uniref:Uncharacterized protein n=1 Tax=Alicyclobacillus fastidiosus TaxID=392011 RepID=A0ABY6ZIZ8_9BACL|nr:hypothetical protein [Alicyclobacillus fastidiosus]WAH41885.1 hypothetical protein NZD89_27415 [Alicyclobacillus fastidiosus]
MKRWIIGLFSIFFLLCPTTAFAASKSVPAHSAAESIVQTATLTSSSSQAHVQLIRGGRSYSSRSYTSRSYSSRSYGGTGTRSFGSPFGGLGSHLFSFGAGFFLGHLFNPFGFGYGYGAGLGLFHIIFDIFIIWVIWRIIRRMFFR